MIKYSLSDQFGELVKVTVKREKETEQNDDTQNITDESAKRQGYFQNNEDKTERKYTTTRIKSRNFLLYIPYDQIKREDNYNENLIFDKYLLIAKNLNPFLLDRKLSNKNKHEMLYMLWKECMPVKFYRHICNKKKIFILMEKRCYNQK